MLVPLIRTLILYVVIAASMRFMGKRQVGELQPTELVITILVSAVASVPMQDIELPLLHGIIPIAALIAAEMLMSALSLRYPRFRRFVSGRPITVIKNGKICQDSLKALRISLDDLLEDLRLKDVFDHRKVRLALVETNGQLSVLLDNAETPPTAKDISAPVAPELPFESVIEDGFIDGDALKRLGKDEKWLLSVLKKAGITCPGSVFIFCCAEDGKTFLEKKDAK